MKFVKAKMWVTTTVVAMAAAACSSNRKQHAVRQPLPDTMENNRLTVRAALAQNVYNGVAMERALYACDFDPGHAQLNELGLRRVQTLIETTGGGADQIVVLQGDAPDGLYTQRIATVRQHLADAGLNLHDVVVVRGSLVGGESSSSKVALLGYDKMLSSYQQKQTSQQNYGSLMMQSAGPSSSPKE